MKEKELRQLSLAVFPIGSVMATDLTARQIRYYESKGRLISPDRTKAIIHVFIG